MLSIYKDQTCLQDVKANETFYGAVDSSVSDYELLYLTGAQVGSVYRESAIVIAGVEFTANTTFVIAGVTWTNDEHVGKRIIHNGHFRGTVASNTSDSLTISDVDDRSYSGSGTMIICSYEKLKAGALEDYVINGNMVELATNLLASQKLHVIPTDTMEVNFGAIANTEKTVFGSFWVKSDVEYYYGNCIVMTQDKSVQLTLNNSFSSAGIVFENGLGTNFIALTPDKLFDLAVLHNGAFVGFVTANTSTTVTITDTAYTAASASCDILPIATMEFSLDGITYSPVLNIGSVTTTPTRVYYRDTALIPNKAINSPNIALKIMGIEYLA